MSLLTHLKNKLLFFRRGRQLDNRLNSLLTSIESCIASGEELTAFCIKLDEAIGDKCPTEIHVNSKFMRDYRRLFGRTSIHRMYMGIPLFLKNQEEYFKVID